MLVKVAAVLYAVPLVASQATDCTDGATCTAACRELGTFHRSCARALRPHTQGAGRPADKLSAWAFAGIAVEVACLTADNIRTASPSWLQSDATCPAACTAAWNALIETCPAHTKSWTLGGTCADNSGETEDDCTDGQWSHTAVDWVPMFVSGDGTGDASSIAARVMLKWLELGLEMDTCALSSPVCDVDGCHSTDTATAVQTCTVMQRLALYSAVDSPATQTSPTQGLGCESTCSEQCTAIEDATWGIGTGACCSTGTQPDGSDCTDLSADLGADGGPLLLDYASMRAVYSASSACEEFICSTATMAAAFCSQTAGSMGGIICLETLTLSTLPRAVSIAGYTIPGEMLSCLSELANNGRCSDRSLVTQQQCDADSAESWTPADSPTSQLTVKSICAATIHPCPGDDDPQGDDDLPIDRTSSARLANDWRAVLVAFASYSVWVIFS